jgi:hypothetical protein
MQPGDEGVTASQYRHNDGVEVVTVSADDPQAARS